MQVVGADRLLGALGRCRIIVTGDEFRADRGRQDVAQDCRRRLSHFIPVGGPLDQVPDERFRHGSVHVVVRHLVADPVSAPAERQLAQIARADDHRPVAVGQPEQVAGALARLYVLERDVVDLFPFGKRVADVLEHLVARRPDVDRLPRHTQGFQKAQGALLGPVGCGVARQDVRQDVRARQVEPVHGARRDDQRLRRVEPAAHTEDDLLDAGGAQPLRQGGDLDVVCLVAALVPFRGVRGDERKRFDEASQQDGSARRREREFHDPQSREGRRMARGAVGE